MSDSLKKLEEIEDINIEVSDRSGIGFFHQTTTQDNFEPEILDEYFVKSEETLMRDLIEEIKYWNETWISYFEIGTERPMNADQLTKELSKKYKISERC